MTKEEAKEFIEELRQLEIMINLLKVQKVADMTIGELYPKLISLMALGSTQLQLSEKIKNIERLAQRVTL